MGKKEKGTQSEKPSKVRWNKIYYPTTIICTILSLAIPGAFVIGQSLAKYEANIVLTEHQSKLVSLQNYYEKEIHDLRNQVYNLQDELVALKQNTQHE